MVMAEPLLGSMSSQHVQGPEGSAELPSPYGLLTCIIGPVTQHHVLLCSLLLIDHASHWGLAQQQNSESKLDSAPQKASVEAGNSWLI